ncbi:hypothetical protein RF55_22283, partial [Lasius niger]
MKAKTKFGMGLKTKKTKKKTVKKRILPAAKRGGLLPILPMLGALGSLIGGAAGVAKMVNDGKAAQHQMQEMLRHNRAMEGHGLYLAPYKYGRGVLTRKKKKRQRDVKIAAGRNYQHTIAATGKTLVNMSMTFTLTGRSSVLAVNYFPTVDLSDGEYELGLADFESYHTISNVNSTNNKFYFGKDDAEITIPEGSYELQAIHEFLKHTISR